MCHSGLLESSGALMSSLDHLSQPVIASGRGQGDVAEVVVDVEVGIVLPVRQAPARPRTDDTLVEATKWPESTVEDDAEALELDLAVERHDAGHHHQVGWVFHPQPGRIDACHRDPLGHSAVIIVSGGEWPAVTRGRRRPPWPSRPPTLPLLSLIHISEPTRLGMISYA